MKGHFRQQKRSSFILRTDQHMLGCAARLPSGTNCQPLYSIWGSTPVLGDLGPCLEGLWESIGRQEGSFVRAQSCKCVYATLLKGFCLFRGALNVR